jgi:AhpD family alkylhydroperoxidase
MTQRLDYVALAPEAMRGLNAVHAHVARCGLDPTLIDLVYLRVSLINGCAYCIDLHTRDLRARDVPVEKIVLVRVWEEAPALFDARERAALAWAETVTRVERTGIPDTAWHAVSEAFEDAELAELTVAIGLMNAYNRLAIAFRRTPAAAKGG